MMEYSTVTIIYHSKLSSPIVIPDTACGDRDDNSVDFSNFPSIAITFGLCHLEAKLSLDPGHSREASIADTPTLSST